MPCVFRQAVVPTPVEGERYAGAEPLRLELIQSYPSRVVNDPHRIRKADDSLLLFAARSWERRHLDQSACRELVGTGCVTQGSGHPQITDVLTTSGESSDATQAQEPQILHHPNTFAAGRRVWHLTV